MATNLIRELKALRDATDALAEAVNAHGEANLHAEAVGIIGRLIGAAKEGVLGAREALQRAEDGPAEEVEEHELSEARNLATQLQAAKGGALITGGIVKSAGEAGGHHVFSEGLNVEQFVEVYRRADKQQRAELLASKRQILADYDAGRR